MQEKYYFKKPSLMYVEINIKSQNQILYPLYLKKSNDHDY